MRLHIMSDLHLEFGSWTPPTTDADLVILAGDIHHRAEAIKFASSLYAPAIRIDGNHEFYGGTFVETDVQVELFPKHGVAVISATLWTSFELYGDPVGASIDALLGLNDYRLIQKASGGKLAPIDTLKEHLKHVRSLTSALRDIRNYKCVVVTHHAPSERSVPDRFKGDKISPAYASNLEGLILEYSPVLWVHGHTHTSFDYTIGNTRVVCNPRGYAPHDLNPDFDSSFIITI